MEDQLLEPTVRVKQIYVSEVLRPAFQEDLLVGHGLVPYHSPDEPAIFYGLMSWSDCLVLAKHTAWKIVVWTGGDINCNNDRAAEKRAVLKKITMVQSLDKIRHIAISSFIANDLTAFSIPFEQVPFMGIKYELFQPVRKGPCIYLYTDLFSEALYGAELYQRILKDYAHIPIIITCCRVIYDRWLKTHKSLPYPGMRTYDKKELIEDVYPKCFIALRLTSHDGLSGTVQEMGMMGIKSIHNGSSPSCLPYSSYEDICHHIDVEYQSIGSMDQRLSARVKEYLRIDESFFEVPV